MNPLGAVAFRGGDSLVPDPGGRRNFSSGVLDQREFGVGESEVDGVGSGVAGGGSSSGSLLGHVDDYTVKQKMLASGGLALYDKSMDKTTHAGTGRCLRCKHLRDADIGTPWQRLDGTWVEWVKVRPHLHGNTYASTCRPRGYARIAKAPTGER